MQETTSLGQRLLDSIKRQPTKYAKLGYCKYLALLTFCLYFTLQIQVLKIIWPYIHGSMPDLPLYVVTVVAVNLLVYTSYNVAMYFIYKYKFPFFEQFRTNKDAQWPWQSDPKEWSSFLIKTLKVNLINILFYGPLLATIDSLIQFGFKMDMQSIPSISTIIWQISLFLLMGELTFYFIHKMIHNPRFYWIHKLHHEYNVTIALAAQYAHPIEHILANNVPAGIGYKLLSKIYPVHIFTIIIWLTFRLFQTCDGHSGYDWPWGQSQLLPFSAGGPYHYFHHKQNVGNYSSILHIFDTIFNTNKDYYKFLQIQGKNKND